MTVPSRLNVRGVALRMDGGTILLMSADEAGREHTVKLVQHANPSRRSSDEVPGRLYFDGQLPPIRSKVDARLLSLLRSADIADDLSRAWTTRLISFMSSDAYLHFAERVEQAADETLYDVWVVWDAGTFNLAVVTTKQLVGMSMREVREVVEQGRPVAQGVRAPEVVDWTRRYREAGLDVEVRPEFRWRLP